jgi:hypothetical protein
MKYLKVRVRVRWVLIIGNGLASAQALLDKLVYLPLMRPCISSSGCRVTYL